MMATAISAADLKSMFLYGCASKVGYKKLHKAEAARALIIAKASPKQSASFEGKTSYHCVFCGNWHLGRARHKR